MENFFPVEVKEEAEKCEVIECDRDVTCLCCRGAHGKHKEHQHPPEEKTGPS